MDTQTTDAALQPRIKKVPYRIAEHAQTVDDNRQAKPWPERQPWCHLHVLFSTPAEQTSPLRKLDWQTESEEAQRSRTQDYASDAYGEYDDYDRHNIGQDMSDKCSPS